MRIYYETNKENPAEVLRVEEELGVYTIKTHHGFTEQICMTETETETTYYHGKINLLDGVYAKDISNTAPIIVNGVEYPLDANGEVCIRKTTTLPEITNAEVVQQINDLRADLLIAGVI